MNQDRTTAWSEISLLNTHTQTLTFADEALLGDGLLAYITALGLLEWLQLEGVCVDALQLVGLWEEEEERDGEWMPSRSSACRNIIGIQP